MEGSELAAREQVRDLIAHYTWAGDRGRIDDLAACFTPDGVLDVGDHGGRWTGRTEIIGQLTAVARRVADHGATTGRGPSPVHHHVSSTSLSEITDGTMSARSYFAVMTSAGLDHWGRYLDRFRCVEGRWLFTERVVRVDGHSADTLMVQEP